jgi:hypothetical protein
VDRVFHPSFLFPSAHKNLVAPSIIPVSIALAHLQVPYPAGMKFRLHATHRNMQLSSELNKYKLFPGLFVKIDEHANPG